MDRLVITGKEAFVIDYKTSHDTETEYEEQVRDYMDLVKEARPHLKVRGFLLFVEQARLEEIYG